MKKLLLLILGSLLIIGIFWFYNLYTSSFTYSLKPDSTQRVMIKIEKGSSADKVANLLKGKNLIKSTYIFKLYLKQNNLSNKIQAGNFVMQENYDLKKIVTTLTEGSGAGEISVTLLEGWTAKQIAEYLEKNGLTKAQDFLDCLKICNFNDFDFLPKGYLEGYLYPDTYFVNTNHFTNQKFINRLISNLKNKLSEKDWSVIKSSKYTFQEIVIMASIIEREERNTTEKAKVADILWSRLENKVALGADATILYALGRTSGGLTYNDLQVDSPYNTRKYRGLPPTPICNPSISSIKAAIYPEKTDYFYYLHDSNGKIHYAKTLEEHNANKRKYIK